MSQTPILKKSICILRLSSIGDITHMIPIVKTLQSFDPKLDITWIINKTEYSLVKNIKNIKFLILDKTSWLENIRLMIKLRKLGTFDILLHMQVSFRANLISLFINASRKVGFNSHYSKNLHSLFINETIDCSANKHVLDVFFSFIEKIGIKSRTLDWDISIPENNLKANISNEKYIVINPFTSIRRFNYREWKKDNYKEIIQYIHKKYALDIIIVGGNSDYEIDNAKIFETYGSYIRNIVGKTTLIDLYNLLRNCRLYIGPDSGTLHIASMLSKPVIGLYATSNPNRTGPYKNNNFVINKYPEAIMKYNDKNIEQAKWGERIRNKNAMDLIKPSDVINKIDEVLSI